MNEEEKNIKSNINSIFENTIEAFLKWVKNPKVILLYVFITILIPIPYLLCRIFNVPYSFYFISLCIGFLTKKLINYYSLRFIGVNEIGELSDLMKKLGRYSPKAYKFMVVFLKIIDIVKK